MQITLPDDRSLLTKAKAAGFHTVDEYVLDLIDQDAPCNDVGNGSDDSDEPFDAEKWVAGFDEFLKSLRSHNPNFDDSRESIYPVR